MLAKKVSSLFLVWKDSELEVARVLAGWKREIECLWGRVVEKEMSLMGGEMSGGLRNKGDRNEGCL